MSHFFPAIRGVNKPAAFWDWFIPVITCVFCAASLNQPVLFSIFHFFLLERRKPNKVPGSTRWSEKYVHQFTPVSKGSPAVWTNQWGKLEQLRIYPAV